MHFHHAPLSLIGTPWAGDGEYRGECAAIAQTLVPTLKGHPVSEWVPGAKVKGNRSLPVGTVIAIFDHHGVYLGQKGLNHKNGKAHTALYVRQSSEGIEVVHQHKGGPQIIGGTLIRFGGGKLRSGEFSTGDFKVQVSDSTVPSARFTEQKIKTLEHRSGVSLSNEKGGAPTPEDDADNYYVVELKSHPVPAGDFEVQVGNSTMRSK